MTIVKPDSGTWTPIVLVSVGVLACTLGEWQKFHDLVTMAISITGAGLGIITHNRMQFSTRDGGSTTVLPPSEGQ